MNKLIKKIGCISALAVLLAACGNATNADGGNSGDDSKSGDVTPSSSTPASTGGSTTPSPTEPSEPTESTTPSESGTPSEPTEPSGSSTPTSTEPTSPTAPTVSPSPSETALPEDPHDAATNPDLYYKYLTPDMTDGENGTFRKKLTQITNPIKTPKYSGNTSSDHYCLSEILPDADEDPDNKDNMIFFYTQESKPKGGSSSGNYWNREHAWPQNNSNDCWGQDRAGSDLLHIRPTYAKTNSDRASYIYGHVSGDYKTYKGYEYGKFSGGYFEPIDKVKGDCARITMYIWTAYHEEYGKNLPYVTQNFETVDMMLEWHLRDVPSAIEVHRNQVAAASRQKNRNPFVDHPEYACKIWGNYNNKTKQLCGIK